MVIGDERNPAGCRLLVTILTATACLLAPNVGHTFCGFYVGGGTADLYNSATMVVLMRDGTRTVLSMQNNYEGPPENFALIVPVPVVLDEDEVKVLPADVFDRIDQMAAPRLVEYWERDPCEREYPPEERMDFSMADDGSVEYESSAPEPAVVVEAEFEVGEYDIVILSANDSSALDTWLRQNGYNIPDAAEPALRPYIESDMKFFVARVNIDRVAMSGGRATLSPLRFHYDSDEFSLPIRLGLLNADGAQDLIVHILAPNQRYEVANYDNVTIPTNLDVTADTRDNFAPFYAALFDKTLDEDPGAVVTEYAWSASTCDPCPGPTLTQQDFLTLGADVTDSGAYGLVLTRLHARYTADDVGEDLVFRAVAPITGGRERRDGEDLEWGASPASVNNFQGRYAIRHAWTGPVECSSPRYGRWGGPGGSDRFETNAAQDLAFVDRNAVSLVDHLLVSVPELGIREATLTHTSVDPSGADGQVGEAAGPPPLEISAGSLPQDLTGHAGGPRRAGRIGAHCAGYIEQQPDHVWDIAETTAVSVLVTADVDTTLIIAGPGGVFCSDDFQGLNPGFSGLELGPGQWQVYVGTYWSNSPLGQYQMSVTAGP